MCQKGYTQCSTQSFYDKLMYDVEKILKVRKKGKKQFYVKWIGYQRPYWNDASNFEDTLAFAEYKASKALGGWSGRRSQVSRSDARFIRKGGVL